MDKDVVEQFKLTFSTITHPDNNAASMDVSALTRGLHMLKFETQTCAFPASLGSQSNHNDYAAKFESQSYIFFYFFHYWHLAP